MSSAQQRYSHCFLDGFSPSPSYFRQNASLDSNFSWALVLLSGFFCFFFRLIPGEAGFFNQHNGQFVQDNLAFFVYRRRLAYRASSFPPQYTSVIQPLCSHTGSVLINTNMIPSTTPSHTYIYPPSLSPPTDHHPTYPAIQTHLCKTNQETR